MKIFRDITEFEHRLKSAISIGNFDGIHAGHRVLVKELCRLANSLRIPSVVVTFDPHPVEILSPGVSVPRLTTIDRRAELLEACGVDYLVVLNTSKPFLELDYQEFFQEYVVDQLDTAVMVEGRNFFFGKNRRGNISTLQELCDSQTIELSIVDIRECELGVTSSSTIRNLLSSGQIAQANELLIDPYQLEGQVIKGAARGRQLGFPTANLGEIDVLIPGEGVYAGRASLEEKSLPAAVHIGPNPTFADEKNKVEVHLIGQDVSLYEKRLKIDLVKRIRGIRKFDNQDELVCQIRNDIELIESCLAGSA